MLNKIRSLLKSNLYLYSILSTAYHHYRFFKEYCLYKILFDVRVIYPFNYSKQKAFSQFFQDRILLDENIIPKSGGFFLEIGSNDPFVNSNSAYLELIHGYSGISVDAIDFTKDFAEFRPNTRFIHGFVTYKNGFEDFINVAPTNGWESQMSSSEKFFIDNGKGFLYNKIKVQRIPVGNLFSMCNRMIDLMLVDVEGAEYDLLQAMPLDSLPRVIVCENNSSNFNDHSKIRNLLISYGYILHCRVWTTDDVYILNA